MTPTNTNAPLFCFVPSCFRGAFRTCPLIILLHLVPGVAGAGQSAAPVTVTQAVAETRSDSITISGTNFGNTRPLVTLNLIPLTVQYATPTQIVVAAPIAMMPPGTYLLTVSRGPSAAENGSFEVTLGSGASAQTAASLPARPAAAPVAPAAPAAGSLPQGSDVAATVGDRVITIADVDREWRRSDPTGYLDATRNVYASRRGVVDTMVTAEVLAREAAARGISVEALLAQEVPKRVITTPESAVLALYQSLGDRTRGATLDELRPALRAWLASRTEPELAKMNYVEELMKTSTRAVVALEPPRVDVARTAQDVVIGPSTAAVELVAFGDLDSREYIRLAAAFGWVRDTFGDRVRIVFKHLPVMGSESVRIAQAAACAHRQDKFWPFHDRVASRSGLLDTRQLKQLGRDAGLDPSVFDSCVDRDETGPLIQEALREAERYAISSSPSFLVNGRLAPPPPAFLPATSYFKRIIEEELLRQSRGRPADR